MLFVRSKASSKHWLHAKDVEELVRHDSVLRTNGISAGRDDRRGAPLVEHRHRGERPALGSQVVIVRLREVEIMSLLVDLPDLYDALGARVREWPEQHAVDDAEDRRRGADPD